jgi:hypothetical protein
MRDEMNSYTVELYEPLPRNRLQRFLDKLMARKAPEACIKVTAYPSHSILIVSTEDITYDELFRWASERWPSAAMTSWNVGWPWEGVSVTVKRG